MRNKDPGDLVTEALRRKFGTPAAALRFLGLDENLLKRSQTREQP